MLVSHGIVLRRKRMGIHPISRLGGGRLVEKLGVLGHGGERVRHRLRRHGVGDINVQQLDNHSPEVIV